ncbi:hypothetical protein MJO29_000660 [Puccinia striiformis f. sp. tritici]|nr:hypothetical protein MJO29_000660 [Puccinia striiformis f. sp. tritici]
MQSLWNKSYGEKNVVTTPFTPHTSPPLSPSSLILVEIENCILTNGVIIRDCVALTDCEAKSGAVIEAVNSPSKKKNKRGHAIGREDAVKGLGSTTQVTF